MVLSSKRAGKKELRDYIRILSLDNVEASQRMSLDLLVQRFLPCTNIQGREPLRLAHSAITHTARPKTLTNLQHAHLNQPCHTDMTKRLANILYCPSLDKLNRAHPQHITCTLHQTLFQKTDQDCAKTQKTCAPHILLEKQKHQKALI